MTRTWLIRVYGGVDPMVVSGTAGDDWEDIRRMTVDHLRQEPYDDEDGLFYIIIGETGYPRISAFAGGVMDSIREEAQE